MKKCLLCLALVLAVALLVPPAVHAQCETECSRGSSSSDIPDCKCCCDEGVARCGRSPSCATVIEALRFQASEAEITAFEKVATDLFLSNDEELRALGDVANELLMAVLTQDSETYSTVSERFAREVGALSERAEEAWAKTEKVSPLQKER